MSGFLTYCSFVKDKSELMLWKNGPLDLARILKVIKFSNWNEKLSYPCCVCPSDHSRETHKLR